MGAILEKNDNNTAVLTIEVSKEAFIEAMKKAYHKNKGRFQIPGFRKGKVPYDLVLQYYGEGILYDDAIEFAAAPSYQAAIEEHKLDVVAQPQIDIVEIGQEKGLIFKADVTLKPEVKLGKYEGVKAVYKAPSVADKEVQAEIDRVLERNARMIPIEDRPVENGDTVTIDFEGFLSDVPFEGGKGEGHDLEIGSNSFIPGFEEQLTGHKIGEAFSIDVTFPENYNSEELKGQATVFKVKIHAIKRKELPKADDEFAKDVSEFDTLDAYKKDIATKKMEAAEKEAKADFQNQVLDAVCANAKVDIPACMIDQNLDQMLEDQAQRMRYQGIDLEQYLQYVGQSIDQFKEGMRPMAEKRTLADLVIEAIAKKEGLEATDEDMKAEAERMGAQYGMPADDVLAKINGNDDFLRESIISKKALDMITEKAVKEAPKAEKKEKMKAPK